MLFKRRKYQRFTVDKGTVVVVSPGTDRERMVHVIDISLGGAAFIYQGTPEELDKAGVIKILSKMNSLDDVNFETVCDVPAPDCRQPSESLRRRSVQFQWMGVVETVQLKSLIKEIGVLPK
jgi:hypothetical protein